MFWKKHKDAVIFGAALAAFTGYVLLDTFVIPRSYESVAQKSGVSVAAETEENAGAEEVQDGAADASGLAGDAEADGDESGLSLQEKSGRKSENASAGQADGSQQNFSDGGESREAAGKGGIRRRRHHSDDGTGAGSADGENAVPSVDGKDSADAGTTGTGSANTGISGKTFTDGNTADQSSTGKKSGNENGSSAGEAVTNGSSSGKSAANANSTGKGTTDGDTADTASKSLNLSGGTVVDSYSSNGKTITLYEYREQDTEIYVADVELDSADALQTAFANDTYGKNVTAKTSAIAAANNAVLAINGDFYGAREKGYVIRNGKLYRDTSAGNQEDLVIYADGSFEVINEGNVTAQELLDRGAVQVLSFGPALLLDGKTAVSEGEEVGKAMASNPRTAIGMIDSLHYVFVVSDGRTQDSEGLSLSELASFMESLGVETAYNLDGGGSSTMYFNGAVVNHPTTSGRNIKERSVSDIVCIQ